jgi:predicted nucleic acid-binding protein
MIVCDTNILSTFARAGEMELLFKLFPKHEFTIPPAVYEEIREAIRRGIAFLDSALTVIDSGQILLFPLAQEEKIETKNLPESFGLGESEAVAICIRRRAILLTNDKRVRNYSQTHGIEVYDLVRLLRALWTEKVVSRQRVQKIVAKIEQLEKIVIKRKDEIFKNNQPARGRK